MATDGSGTTLEENDELLSSDPEPGGNIPKRHARVTVKYNRKELQRRLDVEKWIDENLDRLYRGQARHSVYKKGRVPLIDLHLTWGFLPLHGHHGID
ncbi:hypothetical protein CRENBAI_001025 [Crenichthys baileyi]|uniref:Protein phosphatase 1 regulatory subunit 14A n=1 Tax=Crenichthys baileyi TaxID=28760 RepID=A0AAV9S281_9TELE